MNFKKVFVLLGLVVSVAGCGLSVGAQVQNLADIGNKNEADVKKAVEDDFANGGIRILRPDGSPTEDYLKIYCGDLWGQKGGVEYLPDGTFVESGPTQPDKFVHFDLFRSNGASAFDGIDKMVLEIEVDAEQVDAAGQQVQQVDEKKTRVVLRQPLNFKKFEPEFVKEILPVKEQELEKAQNKEVCSNLNNIYTNVVNERFSGCFLLDLPECEKSSPSDGLYVKNFLTKSDCKRFEEGAHDLVESEGRNHVFKFYKIEDGGVDAAGNPLPEKVTLFAEATYRFSTINN